MQLTAGDERRFSEFMGSLNEKDRIAIISHTDADGVCAAVIASKVINPDYIRFFNYIPGDFDGIVKELKIRKINKVVMLDFVTDNLDLGKIEKFAEILIIDHHPFLRDINSSRIVFLKADTEYPACYMCYYLFSKIQKIPSWIAAIGLLGDKPHLYNQKNCNEICRDFNLDKSERLWETLEDINFSLAFFDNNKKKVYDLLLNAKNIEDMDLKQYSEKVREEFESEIKRYEKEKEAHGNLIIFSTKIKYPIKYLLINKISAENQDKVFAFLKLGGSYISISLRGQNTNCLALLRSAIKDIPKSDSGGHINACGGSIPSNYLEKFKENLIREYGQLK
jgi:single-stranded DNA-specific DHH superfamily exonuclease